MLTAGLINFVAISIIKEPDCEKNKRIIANKDLMNKTYFEQFHKAGCWLEGEIVNNCKGLFRLLG